jgi:hypothetical protein
VPNPEHDPIIGFCKAASELLKALAKHQERCETAVRDAERVVMVMRKYHDDYDEVVGSLDALSITVDPSPIKESLLQSSSYIDAIARQLLANSQGNQEKG